MAKVIKTLHLNCGSVYDAVIGADVRCPDFQGLLVGPSVWLVVHGSGTKMVVSVLAEDGAWTRMPTPSRTTLNIIESGRPVRDLMLSAESKLNTHPFKKN